MSNAHKSLPFLPVRTVVKFYENHDPSNINKLFSKTLRKIGFIDQEWLNEQPERQPQDHEFWLVDVVHETCHGEGKGCFLLHPLRPVEAETLNWLLPGMYSEEIHDGLVLLEPNNGGIHWLVSRRLKQAVKGSYAIIVRQ